ncbi:MAG: hypothetical protein HZA17_08855 [Nitrospirae bacterium]|nr:hypothetical protein [Nitrospirota bacterium]
MHSRAFVVAGAMKPELLSDLRAAVDKAISEGTTITDFRKDFDSAVKKYGWSYKGQRGWRTGVIFNTNLSVAYAAGRFRQDDPFWQRNFPPNGFNCRCTVRSLSEREMTRDGLEVSEDRRNIADEGFETNPGEWGLRDKKALLSEEAGAGVISAVPGQRTFEDFGRPDLRQVPEEARLQSPELLPAAASRAEAVGVVMNSLGLTEKMPIRTVETPVETVALDRTLISHMVAKELEARERFANFIIPSLETPFEVYLTRYDDGFRRRYIGLFTGKYNFLSVVRINKDGSILWNVMEATDKRMNKLRVGELIWPK